MPELAKHIHIDESALKMYIDGQEFPWLIAEQGVSADHLGTGTINNGGQYVKSVHVPILAEIVTVSDGDDDDAPPVS